MESLSATSPALGSVSLGPTGAAGRRPFMKNLQPRAPAAMDFNDDDNDDLEGSLLSADYKAQRRTTQDLVDFLKTAPPPPPPSVMPPVFEDEKKKRGLLQRLRPRKSGSSLSNNSTGSGGGGSAGVGGPGGAGGGGGNGGRGAKRSSVLVSGANGQQSNHQGRTSSNISAASGMSRSTESGITATLPNGKKYVMIAVDYKESDLTLKSAPVGSIGLTSAPNTSASSARRLSRIAGDAIDASSILSASKRTSIISSNGGIGVGVGGDKRRSIISPTTAAAAAAAAVAAAGTDSSFAIDNGVPFTIDNFTLDTDFITSGGNGSVASTAASPTCVTAPAPVSALVSAPIPAAVSGSNASIHSIESVSRSASKRVSSLSKVKFSLASPPMDESTVSEALEQRLASHKAAQQASTSTSTTSTTSTATAPAFPAQEFAEIVLPKPVSRKKVRHVQIQTQHCIMRPMHTQTESPESLLHDLQVKEFSTQTMADDVSSDDQSISGSTEMGGSTVMGDSVSASTSPTTVYPKSALGGSRANSKVASLVASLNQPSAVSVVTTSTSTSTRSIPPSPTTTSTLTLTDSLTEVDSTETLHESTIPDSEKSPATLIEELVLLRQNNSQLQNHVTTLQRDLAAETRARTRNAVAMQDTRDKFELLSAMAYKKLKEMIFQRHVLEMEVRELRTQVDQLQSHVGSGNGATAADAEEESDGVERVVREGELLYLQQQQQQMLEHQRLQQAALV